MDYDRQIYNVLSNFYKAFQDYQQDFSQAMSDLKTLVQTCFDSVSVLLWIVIVVLLSFLALKFFFPDWRG